MNPLALMERLSIGEKSWLCVRPQLTDIGALGFVQLDCRTSQLHCLVVPSIGVPRSVVGCTNELAAQRLNKREMMEGSHPFHQLGAEQAINDAGDAPLVVC